MSGGNHNKVLAMKFIMFKNDRIFRLLLCVGFLVITFTSVLSQEVISFDQYENSLPWKKAEVRYKAFLYALSSKPNDVGYVFFYHDRSSDRRLRKYKALLEDPKYSSTKARVKFILGGCMKTGYSEFIIFPKDASPPKPAESNCR